MIIFRALALCFVIGSPVWAANTLPEPGDIYLISRDRHGNFVGSHKIYLAEGQDRNPHGFCGKTYFVRTNSVAWTHVEHYRGHKVQIEFNFGLGWRPICTNPVQQVSLQDVGIEMSPEELLPQFEISSQTETRLTAQKSRLSAIARCANQDC